MSSSGINAINSGPLIIRSYLGSSSNNTYALGANDIPISSNRVLITSTNGLVVPSDNIYVSSITVSSINGGGSGSDVFWSSTLNNGGIVNTNTGNVRITNNLDCSSIINISSIFAPNTLSISSNQTYVTANKFEYFSTDPSTIDTFKIDLSGSNLLIYNSTISTFDATFVQNNGGGQLVLATDEPIIYINGSANGNNNIGIGTSNPLAALHITNTNNISQVFTTSGTFVVPVGVTTINFEMIGAGGSDILSIGISGTGGYINGTINVTQGQILTIAVGTSNLGYLTGASYINIPSTGPLFVMAGAGGIANNSGGVQQYGGWGGGGTFSLVPLSSNNYVAIGGDGQTSGSGVGGQGGQLSGGGAGGSCLGSPGNPGSGRPNPETYLQASGGFGAAGFPGGSGYTGGGQGCGAGGGSSYYNSLYTTIINSYPGNMVPAGILPGYGRNGQNGYVKISYLNGEPSLITSGAVGIGTTSPQALLDIRGNAITQQIVTSSITTDPSTIIPWANYYGKYNFVSSISTLTLPSTGVTEGSVLIFRNLESNPVTIVNVLSGGSPLAANGAASFVYTQYAIGGPIWVSL